MCKTLLLDVVMPESHQNDHGYVRELSRPTYFYFDHYARGRLHRGPQKNSIKLSKLGCGRLGGDGRLPGTIH